MKNYSKLTAVAVAGCLLLTGCGSSAKTYTDYVQAVLDCTYTGNGAKYMELTDSTEEEAAEVYADEKEYVALLICSQMAVERDYLTDATLAGYDTLAETVLSKVKYTVEPAVKSGSTYHVTVVAEPIDFWDITIDEVEALYDNDFTERFTVAAEEGDDDAYDALEAEWGVKVLEILNSHVNGIGYKDAVNTIVEITVDDDGRYGITDKNWVDIDDLLLDVALNT